METRGVSPWHWWSPPSQVSLWDGCKLVQARCRRPPGDVQASDSYKQHTEFILLWIFIIIYSYWDTFHTISIKTWISFTCNMLQNFLLKRQIVKIQTHTHTHTHNISSMILTINYISLTQRRPKRAGKRSVSERIQPSAAAARRQQKANAETSTLRLLDLRARYSFEREKFSNESFPVLIFLPNHFTLLHTEPSSPCRQNTTFFFGLTIPRKSRVTQTFEDCICTRTVSS